MGADSDTSFDDLVAESRAPLWAFLLRLVGDRSQAEDLYQETLLRAWRAIDRYHDDGRFRSWLFRIAHNVVRDLHRRDSSRPRLVSAEAPPRADDQGGPDDLLEAEQRQQQLETGLRRLSLPQREVLLLRIHSDLTFREIAELLDAPLSTVINRMRDALAKLHDCLETES